MLHAVYKTSSVLTSVSVDHVTFPSFFVVVPLACVSTLSVSVNLNTKPMTNRLNFILIFIRNLGKVIDYEWFILNNFFFN